MRDGLITRRMQATLNSAPDTHRYQGEIDAIIKTTTARSYDPGDRPVNSSNLPDGGGGGPTGTVPGDSGRDSAVEVAHASTGLMLVRR